MTVTPGQPCLIRGLGKETAAGATQGSLGIVGMRDAAWPAGYGSIDSNNGLKYDVASGKPYVDPLGAAVIIQSVSGTGFQTGGMPSATGQSALTVPFIQKTLTNTLPRAVTVWIDLQFQWRMRATYCRTAQGVNERFMSPNYTAALNATPPDPVFGSGAQAQVLSATADFSGFGGWVGTGGQDQEAGVIASLAPGEFVTAKFTVGYSSNQGVAGAYDVGVVYSVAMFMLAYNTTAVT